MPQVELNGALIHYLEFGARQPSRVPVMLIHGSTGDGPSDWGAVAPLLARERHVVVPDCRGHGRSTNPGMSYSFRELAADAAALIGALGYQRAHVVGHSNGGNVALVTLIEHPEVVASCVLQAANAYVSEDLLAREPDYFDPERVEREDPAWRDEMVALHDPTHGDDYWRELLRLTLAETVSEPRLGPQELAAVGRPVLAIEGTDDATNAPAGHAAFIARHVPAAELWRPAGVGHGVHHERPLEWIAKVQDFWARRGTDVADRIWRLRRERYADGRESIFEVRVEEAEPPVVSGVVEDAAQRRAVLDAAGDEPIDDRVRVLAPAAWRGLVARGVADVVGEPDDDAERVTQALLGEGVRAFEPSGRWTRVRLERDGYLGWMRSAAIVAAAGSTGDELPNGATDCFVVEDAATAHDGPDGAMVGRIPFGARVSVLAREGVWAGVRVPGGSVWWVRSAALEPALRAPDPGRVPAVLERFRRFVGVPYLWGGRTAYGFDCSGLSQAFWEMLGTIIPRDADQQARAGVGAPDERRPGDLLFFRSHGSAPDSGITHVAIIIDAASVLHASGSNGGVSVNSLDPASPMFSPVLRETFVTARRFG